MRPETKRPDDIGRLPKRFRDYISELEARLHALQAKRPVPGRTRIELQNYSAKSDDDRLFLPDGTRLLFATASGVRLELFLNDDYDAIEVMAHEGGLAVLPAVSNVVRLAPVKHGWPKEGGR